jgi:hypothetical protein
MDDALLLKSKRSEVLKALAARLQDDDEALALLTELLELHNIQAQILADSVAQVLKGK